MNVRAAIYPLGVLCDNCRGGRDGLHADRCASGERIACAAIRRVLWVILVLNVGVALAKLGYGTHHRARSPCRPTVSTRCSTARATSSASSGWASPPARRPRPPLRARQVRDLRLGGHRRDAGLRGVPDRVSRRSSSCVGTASRPEVDAISFAVMLGTLAVNIVITTWERRVGQAGSAARSWSPTRATPAPTSSSASASSSASCS